MGFEAASILAAAGCSNFAQFRTIWKVRKSAEKLSEKHKITSLPFVPDQTNFDSVAEYVEKIAEGFGKINVLVKNAAFRQNETRRK